jgi:replicative DNA helicase
MALSVSHCVRFIRTLIEQEKIDILVNFGGIDALFHQPSDATLWKAVYGHIQSYGTLPSVDALKENYGIFLPELPKGPVQPAQFYLDQMRQDFIRSEMGKGTAEIKKLIETEKDPVKAHARLVELCGTLDRVKFSQNVHDFRDQETALLNAFHANWKVGDKMGVQLGWPTFDAYSKGLGKGDVVSIVGRPGLGKTNLMLAGASHAWSKQGRSIMFVSMEIKPLLIFRRMSAMSSGLAMHRVIFGELGDVGLKKYENALGSLKAHEIPFHVVDANLAATTTDILMLARLLRPDVIFIDGAYLLSHATERDRFRRVAENMDKIKSGIAELAPTFCSWQFKRKEGKKVVAATDYDLEDIGYSDAIGQHSSIVLGLFEDEHVENEDSRLVRILKGRNGERGQFSIHWHFAQKTDFSEIATAAAPGYN